MSIKPASGSHVSGGRRARTRGTHLGGYWAESREEYWPRSALGPGWSWKVSFIYFFVLHSFQILKLPNLNSTCFVIPFVHSGQVHQNGISTYMYIFLLYNLFSCPFPFSNHVKP
jgi:hypothetical protein